MILVLIIGVSVFMIIYILTIGSIKTWKSDPMFVLRRFFWVAVIVLIFGISLKSAVTIIVAVVILLVEIVYVVSKIKAGNESNKQMFYEIQRLEEKSRLGNNNGYIYYKIANMYYELVKSGSQRASIEDVKKNLKRSIDADNNPDANFMYAEIIVNDGRVIDSIEYLYQAGLGYIKNNNKEKAMVIIQGIEKIDKNCKRIKQLRDTLYPDN